MLRCIIKLLLCVVVSAAMSPYIIANDGLPKNRLWPTTCYLGIDLAKTCVGWYQKTGFAYEINGSIDFSRILLDLDYGKGKIERDGRKHNGSFAFSNGSYGRIGLSYNFLTPTLYHNQFFIGFRYARSIFDFQLKSNKLQCNHAPTGSCTETCTVPPIALRHREDRAIAHWWEVVIGGKVHLVYICAIGCTFRYKFSKKIENNLHDVPFDIPGFGLGALDDAFGYSLYILLRMPLQRNNKIYHKDGAQKSVA